MPASKTLYDHRNPTPVKILARPEDARGSPALSPKLPKAYPAASSPPRRGATLKGSKEPAKPFQPQILRRPQTPSGMPVQSKKQKETEDVTPSISDGREAETQSQATHKRPSQAHSHRQALLSLFNNSLQTSQVLPVNQDPVSAVSTVPASQPISPLTDVQIQGLEPISTRSRVGSVASIGGPLRPSTEKRQTAAGDKAFLLGYLGRIASQEGQ